jgi:hypothetical protein
VTPTELRLALDAGMSRFRHKRSGKVYVVDRAASLHLFDDGDHDDITVIGWPVVRPARRTRGGRAWQYLSPRAIEPADK